jgi:ParB family transcriptional regulator, chromosome partitioning protein
MPKRPNLKAIGLHIVQGAESQRTDHPARRLSANEGFLYLPIDLVRPNPDQPRKHFDDQMHEDLTASVKEKGILQPVLARKAPAGEGYILIAGERRWRAAIAAGLAQIPALIRSEADALEVALIENLQRQNLSALEEAEALLKLKNARQFTDDALAKIIGKSRQSVNDSLILNELPEQIKAKCRTSGTWSKSQLLQVLRAGTPEEIVAAWKLSRAARFELSVTCGNTPARIRKRGDLTISAFFTSRQIGHFRCLLHSRKRRRHQRK